MSAGAFSSTRYAADYGAGTAIHPIRIQPETLALSVTLAGIVTANTAPVGARTSPISAIVTGSKRALGLRAARIAFKFSGVPPAGYSANQRLVLPVLNKPLRASGTGDVGTYLGAAIQVISIIPESVK